MGFWNVILDILTKFGGRPGAPETEAYTVRFLLPSVFWFVLLWSAYVSWRNTKNKREFVLAIAFAMGLCRELFMYFVNLSVDLGLIPLPAIHLFFPPFEHALVMISIILLAYAFMRFAYNMDQFGRSYVITGLSTAGVLYLITAFDWYYFSKTYPQIKFGLYWGDTAFRLLSAIAMIIPLYITFTHRKESLVSKLLAVAFLFFFLDEFLMLINIAYKEVYAATFSPIRHNLHIWAIPHFGAVYFIETKEALQKALVKAEEEKNKSEAIIAGIGDGISIQDINYKILYQNKMHSDMIGKHVGEYCYEAYEKNEDVCNGCPVAASFKDGRIHSEERNIPGEEGRRHFEITSSPLKDGYGKIIAGIEVVREITKRKHTEVALRESEEQYRLIFENSPLGIFHFDRDSIVTTCNENMAKMLGAPREKIIGFNMRASLVDKRMRAAMEASLARQRGHYEGNYTSVTGGKTTLIKVDFGPIISEDETLLGGICIAEDISVRKQAEEALEQAKHELERQNKELNSAGQNERQPNAGRYP